MDNATWFNLPTALRPEFPGAHVWVLSLICPLSAQQTLRVALGEQIQVSEWNAENVLSRGPGCYHCLVTYEEGYDTPCPESMELTVSG